MGPRRSWSWVMDLLLKRIMFSLLPQRGETLHNSRWELLVLTSVTLGVWVHSYTHACVHLIQHPCVPKQLSDKPPILTPSLLLPHIFFLFLFLLLSRRCSSVDSPSKLGGTWRLCFRRGGRPENRQNGQLADKAPAGCSRKDPGQRHSRPAHLLCW